MVWRRNKITGEMREFPDAPQMPADPKFPYEGPQAAAALGQTQTNTAGQAMDNQVNRATIADRIAAQKAAAIKAQADAEKARADAAAAARLNANHGLTPDKVAELQANLSQVNTLGKTVESLKHQYNQNFAVNRNPLELLPGNIRPANGVFNDTAGQLLTDIAKAKGLTSQQFNTPAEQRMFFEPFIPKASDTDERILSKLKALEGMVNSGRQMTMKQLGMKPPTAPPRRTAPAAPATKNREVDWNDY